MTKIKIIEIHYKEYEKPIKNLNISKVINNLIKYVPKRWILGIKSILITDLNYLSGKEKKNYEKKCTLGYYRNLEDNKGEIVIFIDNFINFYSYNFLNAPFFKYLFIGETLYHEIGHHVHYTIKPEYKDKEKVADNYSIYLGRKMIIKRYPYLLFIIIPVAIIYNFVKKYKKRCKIAKQYY